VTEHVGNLVVELTPVSRRHHVDQQALRATVAKAFDHQEDLERPAGRPGRRPPVSVHQAIVPAGAFWPASPDALALL
jgi:hypothetical protein